MQIEFNKEEILEVEKHIAKYPEKKAALMPILWMAQNKWGWLSIEVMEYVAKLLELPLIQVQGVASFYTMYFKKPMGKYHVQVCTNVSCMLRGGDKIYLHAKERFGIGHNERTNDGFISLEECECMGACSGAPMIAINEDFYENLNIDSFDKLIDNLK
ncbi:MAG TPA: NAD(P)H-dependent oxidoreductase subunit E [Candidatus Kapabacteria bacterium]|nr:NAD(P)H-dependent oxidoreductase subunit E [Candidatus Kapabacteria bacterium]